MKKRSRLLHQERIYHMADFDVFDTKPGPVETSFPHFETSAQKVKPPLKKVKPV